MATERHEQFRRWLEGQRTSENQELDKALQIKPRLTGVTVAWYSVNDSDGTYHVSINCSATTADMPIKSENIDFATKESITAFNEVPRRKEDHKFKPCGVCDQKDTIRISVGR